MVETAFRSTGLLEVLVRLPGNAGQDGFHRAVARRNDSFVVSGFSPSIADTHVCIKSDTILRSPLVETELNTYEIQERERLLRTIFDHSPDAIFIEDLEGNVLDANPAACRLHGLKHEQLLGMNVWALVPPEYRSSVARQNGLADGEIEGYSLHSSGRSIPVSIRSSNITFRGKPALLLQVRDITERRRAEEAIRQSESRYRLLFDCNPQPMWVYEVETRRFIAINDAALRLYRYSRDEFLLMET